MKIAKRTRAEKWEIAFAVTVLSLFFIGFSLMVKGLWLVSDPDNFIVDKKFEIKLEKLYVEKDVKNKNVYGYVGVVGGHRLQEQVIMNKNGLQEETAELVLIPETDKPHLVITQYRLKNDFFDRWMKKYNHPRKYTFHINNSIPLKKKN